MSILPGVLGGPPLVPPAVRACTVMLYSVWGISPPTTTVVELVLWEDTCSHLLVTLTTYVGNPLASFSVSAVHVTLTAVSFTRVTVMSETVIVGTAERSKKYVLYM